jgi:oxygen-dependent protoporphyrinogen oxidase
MRMIVPLWMTVTLSDFARRTHRIFYWAYPRLRLINKICPVVTVCAGEVSLPGPYPLCMVTKQICLLGLIMFDIASTDHIRGALAKPLRVPAVPQACEPQLISSTPVPQNSSLCASPDTTRVMGYTLKITLGSGRSSMQSGPKVVIVGGGISGLATAHYIHSLVGAGTRLTLLESGSRLGGKVANQQFSGHLVDTGPDAVLVRVPAMAALLENLGLNGQIVAPASLGAHVWSRGKLRRLPTGTLFGIPDRLLPLMKSGLMTPPGLARAAMDLVLPRRRPSAPDPSIADIVTPRLGSQVFNRLVEPLLGGVHAGRAAELSAHSTVPDIERLASKNRSLYLGLRKMRRHAPPATGAPALVTLTGGLGLLVETLVRELTGDDVRLKTEVRLISRAGTGYRVDLVDGQSVEADAVVLATPAYAAAELLAELVPDAATVLAEIPYVDVATIWLSYPRSAMGRPLDGTGFLVPPEEGKLMVGCTWSSAKWPHLADDELVLIRCMVGRRGDRRWLDMDDQTLVDRVHDELVEAMGLSAIPLHQSIKRWPQAMPQYLVGHQERLTALDDAIRDLPGLHLTGAAYRGVGLASCVADAKRTAQDVAQEISQTRAGARPLTEVTS